MNKDCTKVETFKQVDIVIFRREGEYGPRTSKYDVFLYK